MAQSGGFEIAAKRYAEAVAGIARDGGTQDVWRDDLDSLAQLVQDPQAGPFLTSARVDQAEKRRLLDRALVVSPLAMNLALLLLDKGRLAAAPAIAAAYSHMLDAERGIVDADVTTAVVLSDEERRVVGQRLRAITGANEVRVAAHVDPALIGGMVVRVGDQLIDGSTRTRLLQLKRTLAG